MFLYCDLINNTGCINKICSFVKHLSYGCIAYIGFWGVGQKKTRVRLSPFHVLAEVATRFGAEDAS